MPELVEAQRFAHRAAAFVHEGSGLEQENLLGPDPPFAHPAAELLRFGAEAMDLGDGVDRHEPDVVPVQRVLRAGIAETGPDLHLARVA